MTEILKALDGIVDRVLAYRPKGKGEAATKVRKQIERAERKAKRMQGGELYKSQIFHSAEAAGALAERYGVAEQTIKDVRSGRSRSSVTGAVR